MVKKHEGKKDDDFQEMQVIVEDLHAAIVCGKLDAMTAFGAAVGYLSIQEAKHIRNILLEDGLPDLRYDDPLIAGSERVRLRQVRNILLEKLADIDDRIEELDTEQDMSMEAELLAEQQG